MQRESALKRAGFIVRDACGGELARYHDPILARAHVFQKNGWFVDTQLFTRWVEGGACPCSELSGLLCTVSIVPSSRP